MKLEVFERARALGEAMVDTDEYRRVQAAEAALNEDQEAQQLIAQFNDLQNTLKEMMQASASEQDQAAMGAMTGKLRALQQELTAMPSMKEMNEAQSAFSGILNQVNQVLRFVITGDVGDTGCSGNCAGCTSCHQ